MREAIYVAVAFMLAASAASAHEERVFGRPGAPGQVSRTIRVEMTDQMRFNPAEIEVRQDETVRFIVRNAGKQMHEMVLGTLAELKAHAAMMRRHGEMEHDDAYMAHVAPGRTEAIVWKFTKAGEFRYGCLIPGHFEAGMMGRIRVIAKGETQ